MAKLESVGGGFIKAHGEQINVKSYSLFRKNRLSLLEIMQNKGEIAMGIWVTPIQPTKVDIEKGVDGSHFLTTYRENEEAECDEDLAIMEKALSE